MQSLLPDRGWVIFMLAKRIESLPDPGVCPWSEIGKALKKIGYDGCVVMEPFVVPGGSVGRDVHVWRNLFPELSADYLDKQAADSVKYLREQFEV